MAWIYASDTTTWLAYFSICYLSAMDWMLQLYNEELMGRESRDVVWPILIEKGAKMN